jgi:hypothetical protein
MTSLPMFRKFLFLFLLVVASASVAHGEEDYISPCPPAYCGIAESCPGPAGYYYQYSDQACSSAGCQCQLTGWCGEGSGFAWLCWCEACYSD